MASLIAPKQQGFVVQGGAEAVVHAARRFLSKVPADHAVVKLDFQNAFNSVMELEHSLFILHTQVAPMCVVKVWLI